MPKYPGLGLPLRHGMHRGNIQPDERKSYYPIGAHHSCGCSLSDPLPIREVAMMSFMDTLTDKEEWHKKVFDEEIVAKWHEEARQIPDQHFRDMVGDGDKLGEHVNMSGNPAKILDDNAFEYCIKELQTKAKYFEETNLIPTLNAFATVVKSDLLVSPELQQTLLHSFTRLLKDKEASPDWRPNTDGVVNDLVHPSIYPLVYGRSKGFEKEIVGVRDSITRWAGKGDLITQEIEPKPEESFNGMDIPPEFWSGTYQWLPSNVSFEKDGSVRFTSYINNLHPTKYPDVYRAIEKLIETCLPMWDQCLKISKEFEWNDKTHGRTGSRFLAKNQSDEDPGRWLPSGPQECMEAEVDEESLREVGYNPENDCYGTLDSEMWQYKWEVLRHPILTNAEPYKPTDYTTEPGQRLVDRFRESGLQVVVKMTSIELSPEKPDFPGGKWHIDGRMNEQICGTAVYYLDSENIASSNLSFRMQTDTDLKYNEGWDIGQGLIDWIDANYGASFQAGPCLQNYGSVETRQGRVLCFPNVLHHRVSPFRLEDPTKPGHHRFITLSLVDPHMRIISTANVPPQQISWWAGSVLGDTPEARKEALSKLPAELVAWMQDQGITVEDPEKDIRLPQELFEMVRQYIDAEGNDLPMGIQEAAHHWTKLIEERRAFYKEWRHCCEHTSYLLE